MSYKYIEILITLAIATTDVAANLQLLQRILFAIAHLEQIISDENH